MPGKLTDSAIRGANLMESLQVDGGGGLYLEVSPVRIADSPFLSVFPSPYAKPLTYPNIRTSCYI